MRLKERSAKNLQNKKKKTTNLNTRKARLFYFLKNREKM